MNHFNKAMRSVIQKYKHLIKKFRDAQLEDVFNELDLSFEIKSRKELKRNYSIICNQIHSGGENDSIPEIKLILEKKKKKIAELLQKKTESKKELKKIHKQLSDLL